MAGAIVQSAYNVDDSGGTATTIAASLTGVTAGNTLVAFVGWGTGSGATCSVSDGTSYSSVSPGQVTNTTDTQASQVFVLENVSSGSKTITATFSVASSYRRIRVFEISGVATASVVDQGAGQAQNTVGTTTDSISSGASSSTSNTCFVLGLTQDTTNSDPGSGTMAAGTGYTLSGSNQILAAEYKASASTGAQTATFTDSKNSNRTTHVVALKEAGGSATMVCDAGSYTLVGGSISFTEGIATGEDTGGLLIGSATSFVGEGFVGANEATGGSGSPYTLTCAAGSFALNGQALTLKQGYVLPIDAGSFTLTGSDAAVDIVMSAGAGTFTLTGQNVTLTPSGSDPVLTADAGAFTLTGQATTLRFWHVVPIAAGSFAVSGQAVTLRQGHVLPIAAGSFALSGSTLTLRQGYVLPIAAGSFTLSGQALTLTPSGADPVLTCDAGSFAVSGQATTLKWAHTLPIAAGAFTLSGQAVTLRRGRSASLSAGSFALNGQPLFSFARTRVLGIVPGAFTVSGQPLTLTYSGAELPGQVRAMALRTSAPRAVTLRMSEPRRVRARFH